MNFISSKTVHKRTILSVLSIRANGQAFIDGAVANDADIGAFMRELARTEAVKQATKEQANGH